MVTTAKKGLKSWIHGLADAFRTAMKIDRAKLDQSVRSLNKKAFAQVEQQVRTCMLQR